VQDIAKNGCGKLFVSIEACPAEYDLTAIADGTLRLGDRSHPLRTPDASRPSFRRLALPGNSGAT